MAIPSRPPTYAEIDSFVFKRWFHTLYEFIIGEQVLVTKTSAYTVDANVFYVRVNATGGTITITLPLAIDSSGRQIVIKKIDSSANAVTVQGSGSDTIEGSTVNLAAQWDYTRVISNGNTTWEIIK